eukprot:RCo037544
MSARPLVTVQRENKVIPLPKVFLSPIRYDVIQFVHTLMNLNGRAPYAVTRRAGHQTSAESWGTGRAVARIPRVSGGGTHRSGQGAFGNMCRGGHRFGQPKTFRKWNKACNVKIRKLAVRAALAASAVPALVLARGHSISKVPEIPLVVSDNFEKVSKTRAALKFLARMGLKEDCLRCKYHRNERAGKGKVRGRKRKLKKGPLIICNNMRHLHLALRNIPGVDIMHVKHLNLLRLCPGGHVGRMIVWTESAFKKLDAKFRAFLPGHVVDGKRVLNSEEVQGVVRKKHPMKRKVKRGARANRQKTLREQLNPAVRLWAKQEKQIRKQKAAIRSDARVSAEVRHAAMLKRKRWMATVAGLIKDGKVVPGKEEELKKRFPRVLDPVDPKWWEKRNPGPSKKKQAADLEKRRRRQTVEKKQRIRLNEARATLNKELKERREAKHKKLQELKKAGKLELTPEKRKERRDKKIKERNAARKAAREAGLKRAEARKKRHEKKASKPDPKKADAKKPAGKK